MSSHHVDLPASRDLRFIPTGNAEFDADGFITPVDVFDDAEAGRLRRYFDSLIEAVVSADDPRNSYSINCYHLVCERLHDLALDPRILDVVEAVIEYRHRLLGFALVLQAARRSEGSAPPPGRRCTGRSRAPARSRFGTPSTTSTRRTGQCTSCQAATSVVRERTTTSRSTGLVCSDGGFAMRTRSRIDTPTTCVPARCLSTQICCCMARRPTHPIVAGLDSPSVTASPISECRRAGNTGSNQPSTRRGSVPDYWPNRRRPNGEHPERMAEFFGEFDGIAV